MSKVTPYEFVGEMTCTCFAKLFYESLLKQLMIVVDEVMSKFTP